MPIPPQVFVPVVNDPGGGLTTFVQPPVIPNIDNLVPDVPGIFTPREPAPPGPADLDLSGGGNTVTPGPAGNPPAITQDQTFDGVVGNNGLDNGPPGSEFGFDAIDETAFERRVRTRNFINRFLPDIDIETFNFLDFDLERFLQGSTGLLDVSSISQEDRIAFQHLFDSVAPEEQQRLNDILEGRAVIPLSIGFDGEAVAAENQPNIGQANPITIPNNISGQPSQGAFNPPSVPSVPDVVIPGQGGGPAQQQFPPPTLNIQPVQGPGRSGFGFDVPKRNVQAPNLQPTNPLNAPNAPAIQQPNQPNSIPLAVHGPNVRPIPLANPGITQAPSVEQQFIKDPQIFGRDQNLDKTFQGGPGPQDVSAPNQQPLNASRLTAGQIDIQQPNGINLPQGPGNITIDPVTGQPINLPDAGQAGQITAPQLNQLDLPNAPDLIQAGRVQDIGPVGKIGQAPGLQTQQQQQIGAQDISRLLQSTKQFEATTGREVSADLVEGLSRSAFGEAADRANQAKSLAIQEGQLGLQRFSEQGRLDLQEAGLDANNILQVADINLKSTGQDQSAAAQKFSQQLQAQGMEADQANRIANQAIDVQIKNEQLKTEQFSKELQVAGIKSDDAFRLSEQGIQIQRDNAQLGLDKNAQALQAAGMEADNAIRLSQQAADIQAQNAKFTQDAFNSNLQALGMEADNALQLSNQIIDVQRLNAQIANQRFAQDLQEAGFNSDQAFRLSQQSVEIQQANAQLSIQQFSQELEAAGFESDQAFKLSQLAINVQSLNADTALRQFAQKLQAEGMDRDQAFRIAQQGIDVQKANAQLGIEKFAQQLQAEGMDRDEAFRRAELTAKTQKDNALLQIQTTAQKLQVLGMSRDDEFRQAELSANIQQTNNQQSIQQFALQLQQQGMNKDEAYRNAQLSVNTQQANNAQAIQRYALELQQSGMERDEAFRLAQQNIDVQIQNESFRIQRDGVAAGVSVASAASRASGLSALGTLTGLALSGGNPIAGAAGGVGANFLFGDGGIFS